MLDLFQPGAYFRSPGGNVENVSDQKPVISWAAWNIGNDSGVNGDPKVWDRSRILWTQAGIEHFPWLHCRTLADVDRLISVGKTYQSPAIGLNIEDIQRDFVNNGVSLLDIAAKVAGWVLPIHMPTLPWVQNGQGWKVLDRAVAALEIFPDEQTTLFPSGYNPTICLQCIQHAFDEGLTKVTLMLKTKLSPSTYGEQFKVCHSLFTGDDITPTAPSWMMWQQIQPCVKPAPPIPVSPSPDPRRLWAVPCSVGPRAAHDSGVRKADTIDLVVIHTAEAADLSGSDNTAQGVANFFAKESTQASTQLAVDRDNCVRMLPDLVIPWGASGANSDGLHMEICGRAGWKEETWLSPEVKPMLARAAAKTAKWCWQYNIPRRWLTVSDLKNDKRGITTHVDVNAAFQGGSHWDPGPNFPRDYFIGKVRYWYDQILLERAQT